MKDDLIIKKKIDKYEFISFDIFDTLIKRIVEKPVDIFYFVEKEYELKYSNPIHNYIKNRIEAEQVVRGRNRSIEITLNQIYYELLKYYDFETCEKLKKIEVELEINYSYKNYALFDIYNYALNNKKIIFIISDMYLPENTIISILRKNGYNNWKKLYVSCAYKKTKQSGELFQVVLDGNNIKANQLLHIGDNKYSDNIIPNKIGIDSVRIPQRTSNLIHVKTIFKNDTMEKKMLKTFTNITIDTKQNYAYRLGFETFGKLLYSFSKWLFDLSKREKIDKIFFLSRDGYVMQKAFNLMYGETIPNTYFYASRKVLGIADLCNRKNLKDICEHMYLPPRITFKDFFRKIGIDVRQYQDIIFNMKINIDQEYNGKEIYYKKEIKNFFAIIKQDLLNYSKKQNELFVEYFSKNAEGKRIGIVDIGWYGHMQESISSILKNNMLQKYKIIGFYMGITPRSKIYSVNEEDMHGFLYEPDKNEDIYIRLRESIAIFESCFLAHHGSVVGLSLIHI